MPNSLKAAVLGATLLSSALLGACAASGPGHSENPGPVAEASQWPLLEAPLTERHPTSDLQGHTEARARPGRLAQPAFSCSAEAPSTLVDALPPIEISFIETDVRDAILELSLLTGISIITDESVEGIVSVDFSGNTIEEVLRAIVAPGNFGFRIFDNFIYVGSQSPASPSFHLLSETCMYKPTYLHPDQIIEMLTPYYQQYVNHFEGHDYFSIVAPATIQQRIQKDVLVFDQAPTQILLEMSIIEVSREALDMLGFKWNRSISTEDMLRQNGTRNPALITLSAPQNSASPVAQALIDSVSALSSTGEFVVKAMPSMVTLNGHEANFRSMQTSWLPVVTSQAIGIGSQNNSAVEYGVSLKIIPYISSGSQIRLEILEASVSDLTEDYDDDPKLISHAISTSVLMLDGETLVLGGLLQKKRRNEASHVPGAGSTPLLGGLFRHKESEMVDTEVLIVIRPQIQEG